MRQGEGRTLLAHTGFRYLRGMRPRSPSAIPFLGAALLLASHACRPAATEPAPALPPAPTAVPATVAQPPAPPAAITAGAMPGDVELYADMTGVRSNRPGDHGRDGERRRGSARQLARDMGIEPAQMARLFDAVESVHAGGRRIGGELKLATSLVFSDVQPVRELVAAGKLVEREALGPHGRRLAARDGTSFAWFEAVKLLCTGDGPMLEAIAAVVEGRTAGLPGASPGAPADEPFHARAFVVPALLQEVTEGRVAFPAPLTAAYGLWEGGLRGSIRASVDAKNLPAGLPLPAPRALSIARACRPRPSVTWRSRRPPPAAPTARGASRSSRPARREPGRGGLAHRQAGRRHARGGRGREPRRGAGQAGRRGRRRRRGASGRRLRALEISPARALAVTRVSSSGSSRGVTDAFTTPPAFCSTRMPNAAGSSVTESPTLADIA